MCEVRRAREVLQIVRGNDRIVEREQDVARHRELRERDRR